MLDIPPTGRDEQPFLPLSSYAEFQQIAEHSSRLPSAPRFTFGAMPSQVASQYYERSDLPAVGVYRAREILIGDGFVLAADGRPIVAPDVNLQHSDIRKHIARFGLPTKSGSHRTAGQCALIAGPGYHIYGHWLVEMLPKIFVLEQAGVDLSKIRWIVPADTPTFALEMLRLLSVDESKITRFGGAFGSISADELLVPTFLHNAVRYAPVLPDACSCLVRRIESRHGRLALGSYPERLMISRGGGPRPLVQRREVEAMCVEAGFTVVAPETMPILEQWKMFSTAREVIGEYGSALHATLFSPTGTVVCALRGSEFHPAFLQSGIGELLGQPTGYIFGRSFEDAQRSFEVNKEDLASCLRAVFSGTVVPPGCSTDMSVSQPAILSSTDYVREHDAYIENGQWVPALEAIRKAVALDPENAGAHARRARLLARTNAPGALPAINRALTLGDRNASNYTLKAEIQSRNGRDAEALTNARVALELNKDSGEIKELVARLAMRTGRIKEALARIEEAITLVPDEVRYKVTLYEILETGGHQPRAEDLIRRLYEDSPMVRGVCLNFAKLLMTKGDFKGALNVILRALADGSAESEMRIMLDAILRWRLFHEAPDKSSKQDRISTGGNPAGSPLPVIMDRFTIDFSVAGNSAAHRLNGWSSQEREHVWSVGPESAVLLPPLDTTSDWRIELVVSGCFLRGNGATQLLEVAMEEFVLQRVTFGTAIVATVLIPSGMLDDGRPPTLKFRHPHFVVPRDTGASDDGRPLAICFYKLRCFAVKDSRINSASHD